MNASIAKHGSKSRVKIVDKDVSPSNELLIANPLELTSSEAQIKLPIFTLVKNSFG